MSTASDFIQALPARVNKGAIEGMDTVFHFVLSGEGGGDFTVLVAGGEVKVEEGLAGEPKCTVKANSEHFMKVVGGSLNPMMAILTGKVKVSNQGEMIKYAKLFGLM